MKKILFWPYQVYAWLFFIPVAVLLTSLTGWLVVIFSMAVSPRFAGMRVVPLWARLLAILTPMPVTVEGAQNIDPNRSYIVVSNHVSLFDIPVLYGWLNLDLRWVIKKEIRKMPGVGLGCEKAGHIFVDRRNPVEAKKSVSVALSRLKEGVGILFFAEGTRSLDGRLLPFKKGAFRIAVSEQLPVLPVTLLGTGDVLPAKTLRLFPAHVRVVIHPVIEPGVERTAQLRDLMKRTRDTIESALPEDLRHHDATAQA